MNSNEFDFSDVFCSKSLFFMFNIFLHAGNPVLEGCPSCKNITGKPPKPVECQEHDTCAVFGGWRKGNFRQSHDASVFVTCTGTEQVHCTRCPRNPLSKSEEDEYLFFSNKCDACMYNKNGKCTIFVTRAFFAFLRKMQNIWYDIAIWIFKSEIWNLKG